MTARLTARELFEQQRERLELHWIAGEPGPPGDRGGPRVLDSAHPAPRRPSLAGYLNAIYPNKVQIL